VVQKINLSKSANISDILPAGQPRAKREAIYKGDLERTLRTSIKAHVMYIYQGARYAPLQYESW